MTYGRTVAARFLFLAAWGIACIVATRAAAEEEMGYAMPSRGRISAMLTALFHHNPTTDPANSHDSSMSVFASATPRTASGKRDRNRILDFAESLVYEGGFYPTEVCALMGYSSMTAARIARRVRLLDAALGQRTGAWEVAGRVGRSGSVPNGDSPRDVALMAGGREEGGILVFMPVLAAAYALYPDDGLNAAAQLSLLHGDDPRSEAVGRAAFSLLRRILTAHKHDKDAWLRAAASDALDLDTEHELRAVRVKDWRYLRGEECVMGRLERVVYLWYNGDSYDRIVAEGRKFLQSPESMGLLAALAAVTYGREGLPSETVSSAASDAKLMEIVNDLHDLATSEAVLSVPKVSDDDDEER